LLTLVFHDQIENIEPHISRHEQALKDAMLPDIPFHLSPLLNGHGDYKNISDYNPWGLYIALFLAFEAITAGALLFASIEKDVQAKLKMAIVALGAGVATGVSILFDLGTPQHALSLLFSPNISAPMVLDVWCLTACIIANIFLIIAVLQAKGRFLKVASIIAGVFAAALPVGTAILFITLPGRIGWYSSLEIAVFIATAAIAGVAIRALCRSNDAGNSRLALVALLATLLLAVTEIIKAYYASGLEAIAVRELLGGPMAPLFWVWIIVGLVVPLVLFALRKSVLLAAGLVLAGVLLGKIVFVARGNLLAYTSIGDNLTVPAFNNGAYGYIVLAPYLPSLNEIVVGIGCLAILVVIVALGFGFLKPNTELKMGDNV
jgi:molybdopterin-containing oxidoreductase family membrane subunit